MAVNLKEYFRESMAKYLVKIKAVVYDRTTIDSFVLPITDEVENTILGRKNGDGTGTSQALTPSEVRTLLNVEDGASNYTHPIEDGSKHVPANGTANNGKVLTAGDIAGTYTWEPATAVADTIYSADGTLTGNRAVDTSTHNLLIKNSNMDGVKLSEHALSLGKSTATSMIVLDDTGSLELHAASGVSFGSSVGTEGQVLVSHADTGVPTWEDSSDGTTNLSSTTSATNITLGSSSGSDTVVAGATGTDAGVMSAADKAKLDAINANAEENVATDLTLTRDATTVTIESSTGTNVTLAVASATEAGVMSSTDKVTLDSLIPGAEENVQADWNEADNTSDAYVANKPDLAVYQLASEKGQVNGYAELDVSGKVPTSQLPDSVVGGLQYIGTWDADTNTPDIGGSAPEKGDYYIISVSGSTDLSGITDWEGNDWAVYDGSAWQKVDNTQSTQVVKGIDIVAEFDDITQEEANSDFNNAL